ncbi:MAG: gliding motility-associated protein GldE [Bacteroidales bacterium]|nr:gliding motility-associated protein GldE [Bacteroidales bacterium]MCF8455954.1 gliding motility-associated protein GldE [Bacteroidales bacterium]
MLQETAFTTFDFSSIIGLVVILLLLVASALISGSEVAFFSLSPVNLNDLEQKESKNNQMVLELLKLPEKLLATILIANNFVNVGIVIISTYVSSMLFDFSQYPMLGFLTEVVVITFMLLLFGEIIPKVYASQYSTSFAVFMARPISILSKLFSPLSVVLVNSTSFINKRFQKKKQNLSIDDISHALDITEDTITEDKKILKGIVKFGNIDVKEVMKSRVDVVAVDTLMQFKKLLSVIIESGYSRIPVYDDHFDNIKGILYIKDLLQHLKEPDEFDWLKLLRPAYFVPETKKINDLLSEFQSQKNHLAIVVDEYGGTSGIVTLEDIIEEIVGEITDELDDEDIIYEKLDDRTYLFEGKTLLNDFYRVADCQEYVFDQLKGDAETLAGLVLEFKGEIPKKNETIKILDFDFTIRSVDNRRIKKIEIKINDIPKQ